MARNKAQPKIETRRYGWAIVFRGRVIFRCRDLDHCKEFLEGWERGL